MPFPVSAQVAFGLRGGRTFPQAALQLAQEGLGLSPSPGRQESDPSITMSPAGLGQVSVAQVLGRHRTMGCRGPQRCIHGMPTCPPTCPPTCGGPGADPAGSGEGNVCPEVGASLLCSQALALASLPKGSKGEDTGQRPARVCSQGTSLLPEPGCWGGSGACPCVSRGCGTLCSVQSAESPTAGCSSVPSPDTPHLQEECLKLKLVASPRREEKPRELDFFFYFS